MKSISEISQELTSSLSVSDMLAVKGGATTDDKRRQRPGSTTTSKVKPSGVGS